MRAMLQDCHIGCRYSLRKLNPDVSEGDDICKKNADSMVVGRFWFGLRLTVLGMYRAYLLGREHELQDMLYGFSDIS